jgi:hypothetical protein
MKKMTALLGLAVALALCAAPAHALSKQTYRYVATSAGGVIDVVGRPNTPAGHIAAFGNFQFVTASDHFALRLDDARVAAGRTVGVFVSHAGGGSTFACLPDSELVTFATRPGDVVAVSLDDTLPGYPPTCEAAATAGTVTLLA